MLSEQNLKLIGLLKSTKTEKKKIKYSKPLQPKSKVWENAKTPTSDWDKLSK